MRYDIRVLSGTRVLVDVQGFPLEAGCITILFGESGIGKSLIGKTLFGNVGHEDLDVSVNGERYALYLARLESVDRRREGFFVFQEPSSHLNPLLTLNEQIREGDLAALEDPVHTVGELWKDDAERSIDDILAVYPTPFRPSGGEKQRILAGMAFEKMDIAERAGRARSGLFVFDEPTGSLDREARDRFLDRLFERHRREARTVLLVTHDYSMIGYIRRRHADLEPAIRLLDLSRQEGGGGLQLSPFDPRRYITWLESRSGQNAGRGMQRPFLTVESGLHVFGRTLRFTGPGSGKMECALQVAPGDLVYLKAGSGVGKTTAVKVVMGLQRAEHFRMNIDGVRLGDVSPHRYWRNTLWGKKMTMVFQHADEALNPQATVEESLAILPSPDVKTREGRIWALSTLFEESTVPSLLPKKVWQLSGGQKQRLNLLRAFALATPLLILDEPLNALDFDSIGKVLDAIERTRKAGTAILLISHNEDIFQAIIPPERTYCLVQG